MRSVDTFNETFILNGKSNRKPNVVFCLWNFVELQINRNAVNILLSEHFLLILNHFID